MAARFQLYPVRPRGTATDAPLRAGAGEATGPGVTWRLLGGNNRDLGRAAAVFADVESCLDSVRLLQRSLVVAVAVTSRSAREGWTWRMQVGTVDLAVSSRSYQRRVQTEYAFEVFFNLVPGAEVTAAMRGAHA